MKLRNQFITIILTVLDGDLHHHHQATVLAGHHLCGEVLEQRPASRLTDGRRCAEHLGKLLQLVPEGRHPVGRLLRDHQVSHRRLLLLANGVVHLRFTTPGDDLLLGLTLTPGRERIVIVPFGCQRAPDLPGHHQCFFCCLFHVYDLIKFF